ncbi:MAG: diacylglycerol kinase family protein [Bacteroidota bacterium]
MKLIRYIQQRVRSFGYAFKGMATLITEQPNAQIHLLATGVVTVTGWWCGVTRLEWCVLLLCMALVWTAEAMNTALEHLTDLASPEIHPLAGKAKDVAAAAVLVAAIFAVVIAGIIFVPYFL